MKYSWKQKAVITNQNKATTYQHKKLVCCCCFVRKTKNDTNDTFFVVDVECLFYFVSHTDDVVPVNCQTSCSR